MSFSHHRSMWPHPLSFLRECSCINRRSNIESTSRNLDYLKAQVLQAKKALVQRESIGVNFLGPVTKNQSSSDSWALLSSCHKIRNLQGRMAASNGPGKYPIIANDYVITANNKTPMQEISLGHSLVPNLSLL